MEALKPSWRQQFSSHVTHKNKLISDLKLIQHIPRRLAENDRFIAGWKSFSLTLNLLHECNLLWTSDALFFVIVPVSQCLSLCCCCFYFLFKCQTMYNFKKQENFNWENIKLIVCILYMWHDDWWQMNEKTTSLWLMCFSKFYLEKTKPQNEWKRFNGKEKKYPTFMFVKLKWETLSHS